MACFLPISSSFTLQNCFCCPYQPSSRPSAPPKRTSTGSVLKYTFPFRTPVPNYTPRSHLIPRAGLSLPLQPTTSLPFRTTAQDCAKKGFLSLSNTAFLHFSVLPPCLENSWWSISTFKKIPGDLKHEICCWNAMFESSIPYSSLAQSPSLLLKTCTDRHSTVSEVSPFCLWSAQLDSPYLH